jgi:glycerol-3-phosphate dehydrogenase
MAEETIDKAIKEGILEKRKCETKKFSLYTHDKSLNRKHLRIYGNKAIEIENMICENNSLEELLHPNLPYNRAEILWICRNEMPLTLEDILARRTRSLFLDVSASLAIAAEVANLMAGEFRYDNTWKEKQLEEYSTLTLNYL